MKSIIEAIITRGPIGWFRRLFTVVRAYGHDINTIAQHVDALNEEMKRATHYIKKATKIHVDVDPRMQEGQTTAILCGRYKGRDHVQIFDLRVDDMGHLIDQLKHMQRAANIHVDAPYHLDATIERALKI